MSAKRTGGRVSEIETLYVCLYLAIGFNFRRVPDGNLAPPFMVITIALLWPLLTVMLFIFLIKDNTKRFLQWGFGCD